jgi:hypothetical protein
MFEATIILSVVVVAALVAVIVAMVMKGKKSKSEAAPVSLYEKLEAKAMKLADEMSAEEKNRLVGKFGTGSYDSETAPRITTKIDSLNVLYVTAYGVRYESVRDAIERSAEMSEETALRLLTLEKELYILRKEKFNASRHYKTVKSPLFGTIYSYNACTIGIETKTGAWADKAPRMAMVIERKENGSVRAMDIYLADEDIATASSYLHFDLRKEENVKRFEELICKQEKEYGEEIEVIQTILSRVEKYNFLIEEKLLKVEAGRFVFNIPTDKQLKELKKFDTDVQEHESNPKVVNIFEFMHSSQE